MTDVAMTAVSPASSGPAGATFEGQVGATYLLAMLIGAEPRGLPSTTIDRVELQRAAEGFPLDDVIVHAHDLHGAPAVLEIQVKRSITFAPSDPVFKAVVEQVAAASKEPGFWDGRHELAIATAQISRKISGAYQDVLTWARQLDAATFSARIRRVGSANADMRAFHETFIAHLRATGSDASDTEVWELLRRLQILFFDYTATGSANEYYARERALHALAPADAPRAGALWDNLQTLAIQIAASGGQRERETLIKDIAGRGFHLAGERRHAAARAALAEASQQALADIGIEVHGATVGRYQHLGEIRAAFEGGRYVEIRGEAGVGKSGLLKHFALQVSEEGRIFVLTPGRVTPRGWTALRNDIGFEGTANELLLDLAAGGGVLLCVDSLDFFDETEQKTVSDLLRAAATVPGAYVLATARRDFGAAYETWLPADALAALGKAPPIIIGELSGLELDELRQSRPHLAPLLSDNHPARDVTRNLFRLARLADLPPGESLPRSEVDMAELWWRTADGKSDAGHRERARLLRSLAEQALARTEPMSVIDRPSEAVESLIRSESLRDLGNDRVTFRHDVLRDWAVANLLNVEPDLLATLPLKQPPPVALVRGVELAARFALERQSDGTAWATMLNTLSRDADKSWRRAALLALVHSELAADTLSRATRFLLADDGALLRELIPLVMAVDSQPGKVAFAGTGIDSSLIPDSLNVPSAPSWVRLIAWLLLVGDALPGAVIPEVAEFFQAWCIGMMGRDRLTLLLLPKLRAWLAEIETARDPEFYPARRSPFGGVITYDRLEVLEDSLRMTFLSFCFRTPDLAVAYLQEVKQLRRRNDVYEKIIKFRGSLAQAAPAELAAITAEALIPTAESEERRKRGRYGDDAEALTFVDKEFIPESPAQGPFFELLTHAPTHGFALIRKIIDHVVDFNSKGSAYGDDAFFIDLPDGVRAFPWCRTYNWARHSHYFSLTSALMALEAWAHARIEAGEAIDVVIKDVIGAPDAPACYLLVVVDLLISHWPASSGAAVPFVACPELLVVDRERQAADNFEMPDFFGLRDFQKEPVGLVSATSLKARPSRRISLDELLTLYAVGGRPELRDVVVALLRKAQKRLGTFSEATTLADPEFMVVHALNRLDPANYRDVDVERADGSKANGRQYVSPHDEDEHFRGLRETSHERFEDNNILTALELVIEDRSRSTPALAEAAARWAQRKSDADAESEEDGEVRGPWRRQRSVLMAAMVTMRDGSAELRAEYRSWAMQVFSEAFAADVKPADRGRTGLRLNPLAMAFAGLVFSLDSVATPVDLRQLFEIAARGEGAPAYGLRAVKTELENIEPRLLRSLLRIAFAGSVRPWRNWDSSDEERAEQAKALRQRCNIAIDAELDWLFGQRPEPAWPSFPIEDGRGRRRGFRIGGSIGQARHLAPRKQTEYVDHRCAASWLSAVARPVTADSRGWLLVAVEANATWTYSANGAALPEEEEAADPPREWNAIYFAVLAQCLPSLNEAHVDRLILVPLASLPDRDFFDVVARFLRSCDEAYFNDGAVATVVAVRLRERLSERLMMSPRWRRLRGATSTRVEMHLGPAAAVFFFNDNDFDRPAKCYLLEKAARRLDSFLPLIEKLAIDGASPYVATLTLNVLEVVPQSHHLSLLVNAMMAWLETYSGDRAFWLDHGVGRRACILIDAMLEQEPAAFASQTILRGTLDRVLAALVALGVPEARRLELKLANR